MFKKIPFIFIATIGIQSAMANTLMLSNQLNDIPALTITAEGFVTALRGFYISRVYTASTTCSDATDNFDPNGNKNNFAVPTITVTDGTNTSIGAAALYNVLATSYKAASREFPSNTTSTSLKISAITILNYTNSLFTGYVLKTSDALIADACYTVNCNVGTQTCTVGPATTGFYQ